MPVKHLCIFLILWNTTLPHIMLVLTACPDCCHSLTENDEKVYTLSTESAGKRTGSCWDLQEKVALLPSLPDTQTHSPF